MLKQIIEIYELLDDSKISGIKVAEFLKKRGLTKIKVNKINKREGSTDFIKIIIQGTSGKQKNGNAPTLGIIGRLGGIGARPEKIGLVSDADGAITALSCALKLADMQIKGDILKGDVIIATHICPNSPIEPHEPVPFMGSPVNIDEMNRYEVDPEMDAILSIDTTKGNRIINYRGFAITPTVREGYILRISEDLLNIMEWTTGKLPRVLPVTTQDITPYGNGLFHLNSIMQPCTVTSSPVVGVAITSETAVPGCGTGANHIIDIEEAGRFCIEVAKAFSEKKCKFYDENEFNSILKLYGSMSILQTKGNNK
ncbi:DUF1177 domain-containing protein [candidate division KSB1 bacterium]|nr:MAG: DUF1177 domain-containing protein [candidate division KSB1 bacterium]